MLCTYHGAQTDELIGTNWVSITHPDDIQDDLGQMVLLNAGEITGFRLNKRIIGPDGQCIWVKKTIAAIGLEKDTHRRHLSMIDDISEQVVAAQRLDDANRLLRIATLTSNTDTTASGPRLQGLRVLVVDDSEMNRDLLARALQKEGATVIIAIDGNECLQVIKNGGQAFDTVLMEIQMSVMDGLAATRAIRRDLGLTQLPVIAITAGVLAEEVKTVKDAGFNDFLAKPVDLNLLVDVLSHWCPQALAQNSLEMTAIENPSPNVPSKIEARFPLIPGLDTEEAALRLGNDRAFFLDLLGRFVSQYADAAALTCQDIECEDRSAAKSRLHTLRGIVGTLGGKSLMKMTQELETAVVNGIPSGELQPQLTQFVDQFDSLISSIRASLSEHGLLDARLESQEQIALDQEKLHDLIDALSHSALEALDHFSALRPALEAIAGSEAVRDMSNEVKSLRFAAALEKLHQLMSSHSIQ